MKVIADLDRRTEVLHGLPCSPRRERRQQRHGLRGRRGTRAACGCGWRRISSGVPLAMISSLVQHRDAMANAKGRGHVVADHHRGHPQPLRDVEDHLVDVLGGDRDRGRWSARRRTGSRARARCARARPTRLRMPPESSAGYFFSMLKSPSELQLLAHQLAHLRPASCRWRCSSSGNITFSSTVIESKSAAYWKSMPNLRPHPVELEVVHRHDVLAVDQDLAVVGLEQPDQVLHDHRLARRPIPPMITLIFPRSTSRSTPAQHLAGRRRSCAGRRTRSLEALGVRDGRLPGSVGPGRRVSRHARPSHPHRHAGCR